jgi:hypothetical protein
MSPKTQADLEELSLEKLSSILRELGSWPARGRDATIKRILHHWNDCATKEGDFAVAGFPTYVVRVDGDVAKLFNRDSGEEVRPSVQRDGYACITLHLGGGRKRRVQFGRLILLALVGEPDKGQSCDHIDQNRSNNKISNLRWATAAEQRANQGEYQRQAAPRPVLATNSDDDNIEYVDELRAASEMIFYETDAVEDIANEIKAAIASGDAYRGHTWSLGPPLGTNVIEWRPFHETFKTKREGVVSECGLIKEKNGRITAGTLASSGYRIYNGAKVHRIVAASWVPEGLDFKFIVDHWDRCITNNHASNLRWTTKLENALNCDQPNSEPVRLIDLVTGLRIEPAHISERACARAIQVLRQGPVFVQNIQSVLKGQTDSAYGFGVEYVDDAKRAAADAVRAARHSSRSKERAVIPVDTMTGDDIPPSFASIKLAMDKFPSAHHISDCCNPDNTRQTSGGYGWRALQPIVAGTTRTKNKSTKALPIAHVAMDDTVIKVYESKSQAAIELTKYLKVSDATLSRRVSDRPFLLYARDAPDRTIAHSKVRNATLAERTDRGFA